MIVAIPLDSHQNVFHYNPCACAMFSLYEVFGNRKDIRYRYIETRMNPWEKYAGEMIKNPKVKSCECERTWMENPHHISEHYALLEAIGRCHTLIVDHYCLNTLYTMKNVGIKLHKVPPFIKTAVHAIEHFVIGTEIAEHLRYVHPA